MTTAFPAAVGSLPNNAKAAFKFRTTTLGQFLFLAPEILKERLWAYHEQKMIVTDEKSHVRRLLFFAVLTVALCAVACKAIMLSGNLWVIVTPIVLIILLVILFYAVDLTGLKENFRFNRDIIDISKMLDEYCGSQPYEDLVKKYPQFNILDFSVSTPPGHEESRGCMLLRYILTITPHDIDLAFMEWQHSVKLFLTMWPTSSRRRKHLKDVMFKLHL